MSGMVKQIVFIYYHMFQTFLQQLLTFSEILVSYRLQLEQGFDHWSFRPTCVGVFLYPTTRFGFYTMLKSVWWPIIASYYLLLTLVALLFKSCLVVNQTISPHLYTESLTTHIKGSLWINYKWTWSWINVFQRTSLMLLQGLKISIPWY